MSILGKVAKAVQWTFTEWAETAGESVELIQRQRKLTAQTLVQSVVWALIEQPAALWNEFAQMAQTLGVAITPNGLKQRFHDRFVRFLKEMLLGGVSQLMVSGEPLPGALLERFGGVYVGDSTTLRLPDELAEEFAGCGGAPGAGQAALKLQVRMNLCTGAIDFFQLEPGKNSDARSALQTAPLPAGALLIQDLGYFDIGQLARRSAQGVFWISRIQCQTAVFSETEEDDWELLRHLQQTPENVVDLRVRIGARDRLACRLLAVRCPQEVADRRRQQVRDNCKRKGRQPSARQLAWCDWVILVTNLPAEKLSWQEAIVLYRSRWQIELLFKLWKSQGLVAHRQTLNATQRMALLYAQLIAVLIKHWLVLAGTGDQIGRSLMKAARIVRSFAKTLALALPHAQRLEEALEALAGPLRQATVDRRKTHPSWFQLITNPELLEWEF